MAKPTRSAMAGLKKLASYLNYTKEMKIHYPKVELHQIVFTNWKDNDKVVGKKPHQLEFFSDADWASCKTTTVQWCVKTRLKCCQVTSCSIFYGFGGVFVFFSSACVMSFHVCFFKILSEISMAPQFRACRTGLQRNASF